MNADSIKTICSELERKLIETRDRRIKGKIFFEANVIDGGISGAKLDVQTMETWNLRDIPRK